MLNRMIQDAYALNRRYMMFNRVYVLFRSFELIVVTHCVRHEGGYRYVRSLGLMV